MKRGLGILFAALLSVSAIQLGARGGNKNPGQHAGPASSEQASANLQVSTSIECPDFREELLDAIREFYKVPAKLPAFSAIPPGKATVQQKPQFLIATLPDPVHTHLGLFFDRNIEMIGQAAQTEGYIFDRQVLPWDNKSHPESSDFRIRDKEKACTDLREDFPGLLVFRKEKDPLFVFVVGEQPTGGINYLQFHRALEMIDETDSNVSSLRILGPTFSGSLYSLDKILRNTEERLPDKIYVHSGTITSWTAADQFIRAWQGGKASSVPRTVQFVTFQESDQYRLRHFLRYYIATHGYKPDEVAEVSEGETTFGSFQGLQGVASTTAKNQQGNSCQGTPSSGVDVDEARMLHLYFPREISQLRSAYQHDIYMDQGAGATGKPAPRSTLKLDFDNAGNNGDSIPSYSGKQLPLSQESVLLGIVTSLKKHRSRFVVLRATDPLDELFLSRFLRQAYPDGRIVTFGGDLLYNRQEDSLLHGLLAMSTYPLITDMHKMLPDLGSEPVHVDRNFPFSYGVGTYNAMLSLLVNGGALVDNPNACSVDELHLPQAPYEQYGWPSIGGEAGDDRLRTPPLWLSVMGRDGYWPMALLDGAKSPTPTDPPSRLHQVDGKIQAAQYGLSSSPSWSVLWGLCIIVALIHLLLIWGGTSMSRSEAFAQFAPHKNWRRIALLLLAGISILSVLEILINVDTSATRSSILAVVAAIFAVGFLCDLDRRGLQSQRHLAAPGRHSRPAVLLSTTPRRWFWIVGITAIVLAWGIVARMDAASWRIFRYRSVHMPSGVSPILPVLLLLAGAYWCFWHCLSGASLLDRRRPRLPAIVPPDCRPQTAGTYSLREDFKAISIDEVETLRLIAKPFTFDSRILIPLVMVVLAASLMFNPSNPVETLESSWYGYIYTVLLYLIAGMLLSNLFRMLAIWLECRHLLVALDRLPLRRAFRRLNGFSWKPIWRPGGSAFRDSYRIIAREMESLSHLRNVLEKQTVGAGAIRFLPDVQDRRSQGEMHRLVYAISRLQEYDYKKLRRLYQREDAATLQWKSLWRRSGRKALMIKQPARTAHLVEGFKILQQKIADVCGMALNFLQHQWAEEEEPVVEENKESKPSARVQLAEEFVALIYSSFIMNVLLRIRTIIMCVTGMFIFILLSLNSYPFQPQSTFRVLLFGLFAVIGCVVGSVYAQMHRDPTLSLLTDTEPGKLGKDFWIKLAGFGAVPLVSLVASQFPEVNSFLFSWLQPALEALK